MMRSAAVEAASGAMPLLRLSLEKKGEKVVPLDIMLTQEKRILIISGPNAGGKSVCLKTVGLLQYMLQCGLSIPVSERSKTGVFQNIMIDIGDEQSLENDLSTYSSHLLNMKNMMKAANGDTIILIDEFGTGTEPGIGGAIAEAVLDRFCQQGAYGVITTHYQNLKHFADSHEGVANGAMLYDRHEMKALFQLAIGRPGSSFAIEIARKIGLPEEVIKEASDIVGSEYIQSDKYLQDIVRDKRYWENKRQSIHQREKDMEKTISRYESDIEDIERSRKQILAKAKQQAEELLKESNKKIENAIREIREKQAEKEETKRIRQELDAFKEEMQDIDTKENDDKIARKIAQIQQRKERHAKRKAEKTQNQEKAAAALRSAVNKTQQENRPLSVGDTVRIKGLSTMGTIESIAGDMATAVFGGMRTKMRLNRLEHAVATTETDKTKQRKENLGSYGISTETRNTIDKHKTNFHQDLDIRGMRGDEALNAVQYFIDDAILVGMPRVRILHGKGNGILRQLIRQYLSSVPNVTHFADEHVQFGGAMGTHPTLDDPEVRGLKVAVLPLPGGEFYHFGTSRELLSSTLAIQNLVNDQRRIMHLSRKPHPSIFIQNTIMSLKVTADNTDVWIENSFVGKDWSLSCRNIITGVPVNEWHVALRPGQCVDIVPMDESSYVVRPYGFDDKFAGDEQQKRQFPVANGVEEAGRLLRYMLGQEPEAKRLYEEARKMSADRTIPATAASRPMLA